MRKRVLLVNPWIFDFAAYNFWSRPLGLLKVAEFLSQYDLEIDFVDATDACRVKHWGIGKFNTEEVEKPNVVKNIPFRYKKYGISYTDFIEKLRSLKLPDLVLMTSIMTYWYPGVQRAIELVRQVFGRVPVVLGGIYATLYSEHALRNSGSDIVFTGRLDERFEKILGDFGINFKVTNYKPYYKQKLYKTLTYAPLLTTEGCPFKCSYCASTILYGGYRAATKEKTILEIEELLSLGVKDFAFYDDALLFNPEQHIKPLLREINQRGLKARFHTPNGLHARYIDTELAGLMKKVGFKTLRLSLETVNERRLLETGQKVQKKDLLEAVKILKKVGFTKEEIGVYVMYGLPGQEIKEVKESINFLKPLDVKIHLTEFSPLKGTKSYDDILKKGLIPENLDPLLTNNTVFSYLYSGYNISELRKIKEEVKIYNRK
ncbi:MAG: radical SAM protein [Thermodesulfovibrionales bacterium]|nr:radical SAM protein [Thermodesulfovibrionales bacterium]